MLSGGMDRDELHRVLGDLGDVNPPIVLRFHEYRAIEKIPR